MATAPATLDEMFRADPRLIVTVAPELAIQHLPIGSRLMICYKPAGERVQEIYVGTMTSRATKRGGVIFKMHVENRGVPGEGAFRTFSTPSGTLVSLILLAWPAPAVAA